MPTTTLDPIARLTEASANLAAAEAQVAYLVRVARNRKHSYSDGQEHTWQEIGDALGTSRQAAQQRFG
jgi:hypothetical protein